jgi:hypothetical protein
MTNEEALSMLKMRLTLHDDDKDIFSDEMKKVLEKDKEAIKMAISALERDRWIPVTERLPEEDGYYECTVKTQWSNHNFVNQAYWSLKKWSEVARSKKVLAWRTLPEPYHPQKLNNADEDTAQSGLQSAT